MVSNQNEAVRVVTEVLLKNRKAKILNLTILNNSKHAIISTDVGNFYVVFKRDFFNSFGQIFNDKGVGESINEESLEFADKQKANLLFVYPDGKIYTISAMLFKKLAKENEWIRKTSTGEETYSIPVRYLTRW